MYQNSAVTHVLLYRVGADEIMTTRREGRTVTPSMRFFIKLSKIEAQVAIRVLHLADIVDSSATATMQQWRLTLGDEDFRDKVCEADIGWLEWDVPCRAKHIRRGVKRGDDRWAILIHVAKPKRSIRSCAQVVDVHRFDRRAHGNIWKVFGPLSVVCVPKGCTKRVEGLGACWFELPSACAILFSVLGVDCGRLERDVIPLVNIDAVRSKVG